MKRDFIAQGWGQIFAANGLGDFDSWWNLQADWFEPPNERRGGWSGVCRVRLDLPDGGNTHVFLKRQENHVRKTWRHPLRGEATFVGEMENLQQVERLRAGTLEALYFGHRKTGSNQRAILVTLELSGFRPLKEITEDWWKDGWQRWRTRRMELLKVVAVRLRRMHRGRRVHNSLYPKHIFVNPDDMDVRFIDLEKMRSSLTWKQAAKRDLDSLNRRSPYWSRSDRLRFLLAYLGQQKVNEEVRSLWRYLGSRWRPPGA